jgi:hypothetical protein
MEEWGGGSRGGGGRREGGGRGEGGGGRGLRTTSRVAVFVPVKTFNSESRARGQGGTSKPQCRCRRIWLRTAADAVAFRSKKRL